MGHGELSATGLEMPAETDDHRRPAQGETAHLAADRVAHRDHDDRSGCPDGACDRPSLRPPILWMEADYGWDRWRAYDLLTHVGRISVGYYGLAPWPSRSTSVICKGVD